MGWEYIIVEAEEPSVAIEHEEILNNMGREGWELVSVGAGYTFYFKRRLPEISN
jgi:hypothetical protein